jgi:hypothetical protein
VSSSVPKTLISLLDDHVSRKQVRVSAVMLAMA